MVKPPNKSSLTPGQARLIELMQSLNFGRVEELQIRNGQIPRNLMHWRIYD
jgi:hypothetical protein